MAQALKTADRGPADPRPDTVDCDLLVIGSGAAAFTAALTAAVGGLNVLMVEKEEVFGGASARSGGCLWIPNTSHARKVGAKDSRESALTFLRNEAKERYRAGPAQDRIELWRLPKMPGMAEDIAGRGSVAGKREAACGMQRQAIGEYGSIFRKVGVDDVRQRPHRRQVRRRHGTPAQRCPRHRCAQSSFL